MPQRSSSPAPILLSDVTRRLVDLAIECRKAGQRDESAWILLTAMGRVLRARFAAATGRPALAEWQSPAVYAQKLSAACVIQRGEYRAICRACHVDPRRPTDAQLEELLAMVRVQSGYVPGTAPHKPARTIAEARHFYNAVAKGTSPLCQRVPSEELVA